MDSLLLLTVNLTVLTDNLSVTTVNSHCYNGELDHLFSLLKFDVLLTASSLCQIVNLTVSLTVVTVISLL